MGGGTERGARTHMLTYRVLNLRPQLRGGNCGDMFFSLEVARNEGTQKKMEITGFSVRRREKSTLPYDWECLKTTIRIHPILFACPKLFCLSPSSPNHFHKLPVRLQILFRMF